MRRIEESGDFKRAKKRIEKGGRYRKAIKERFVPALIKLANDIPLDYSYHDHELTGNMKGYRDCHITFDLFSCTSMKVMMYSCLKISAVIQRYSESNPKQKNPPAVF